MCEKNVRMRTIVYFVIAALILGISMGAFLLREHEKEKMQVDILFLGDSLIGQYRDETSIPYLVGQALGKTTFNGAFGGSTMTWYPSEESDYYHRYGLNFPALVQAICTGDFGVQKSLRVREVGTEDFQEVIQTLETIDYDALDVLVLEYGTNDYFSGALIQGEKRTDNFAGSFTMGVEALRERFPNLRIVVAGPTFNWHYVADLSCEEIEFGGGYLSGYVETLENLCAKLQIEYIDLFELYDHSLNIYEANRYTEDGIHPNEYGRQLIADEIVKYLTQ